ncbi:RsbRD N-terminal domain-containing protein [Oleidesulfovibrio sp.]|uniref:RsbRD N-terminal domain-containing protein n=1 Tax=Oleidesulfovibrio sp. TaxID=2909707 RepID=UPI003A8A71B3
MTLNDILIEHRELLIDKWTAQIHQTYPIDTVGFLRSQKDQFHNPVGDRTEKATAALFDMLTADGIDPEAAAPYLDDIIRVRAIQKFTPEQAVAVIYFLKSIVRESLKKQVEENNLYPQLLAFESQIDTMVLISFGIFAHCREKLHMMRAEEYKRRYAQLIRRAERILDTPAGEPDI